MPCGEGFSTPQYVRPQLGVTISVEWSRVGGFPESSACDSKAVPS